MKAFFVDFEAKNYGMLTTYVEATCKRAAKEALKRYVDRHNGMVMIDGAEEVFLGAIKVYPIDEIPADCAYLNEDGRFMSPKGGNNEEK